MIDWRSTARGVFGQARIETPTRARPIATRCARCLRVLQLQAVAGYGDGRAYCRPCSEVLDAARGPGTSKPAKVTP